MRIALFTETFLPRVDGIVTTLRYLLEHLEDRGQEVMVFAPSGAPREYAGARVVGLRALSMPLYPELRLAPPPPVFAIHRMLADFRPEIVHVVNPISLGLAGLRYARRRDVPLVASYHTDLPGFAARWGLAAAGPALWSFIRYTHGDAALNLCPSHETMEQLAAKGVPNLAVWGRGVDTRRFNPSRRDEKWRTRLTAGEPHRPLLLSVGRLAPEKRVDWIADVLRAIPEARLAIIGDGPSRARLESRFANMPVVFTGYLHGDDLADAYAAADAFVLTGANETLGMVVLEAMASGVPVVAPNSGGVLDHVHNGDTGLLFEADDRAALVDAVRRLLSDPALASRLSARGRASAEALSWREENDRLMRRYEDVVAGRPAHDPHPDALDFEAPLSLNEARNRGGALTDAPKRPWSKVL